MSSYRLDIEYDGSGFSGWARQPGARTVQSELEAALETVLREPVALTVAGRTDAGVHARGQVASFSCDSEVPGDLVRRLNGICDHDVAVVAAAPAADGFDARGDAISRSYRYRLLTRRPASPFERGRALWWPHRVDRAGLDACAAVLPGRHDFTAFTPTQTDHVHFERTVFAAAWERGGGRRPRLRDHRRRLHAQHGQGPGRDDARGLLAPAQRRELRGAARRGAAGGGGGNRAAARLIPGVGRLPLGRCLAS